MRILVLSQHFPPEPVVRLRDLTERLVAHGHKVSVLTTFPSYPLGKVYDGYSMSLRAHHQELGARITRVAAMPYRGLAASKRMLSYGSFAATALLLGLLPGRKPDVIYTYHPPLTTGLIAALYSQVTRVPFVYDVQDLWPEAIVASGLLQQRSLVYRAIRLVEDFVYRRARFVTVISEGMRRNLLSKGVPARKIRVISNWGDPDVYKPEDGTLLREQLGWQDRFVVMLAGNLGLTHGLETVLDAAETLRSRHDILFVFVGSGAARDGLVARAEATGLTNVQFIEQVPAIEAAKYINASDLMLVHLKSSTGGEFSVPHRIFSYMLCGKPIIAASEGSTADLVSNFNCGWSCPPSDGTALAKLVTCVALDPADRDSRGRGGLVAAHDTFSRKRLLSQIEQVIAEAHTRGKGSRKR
jgi:glycosyltransferase involved in cell wall biosynthesis